jgi:hypothetical protein
MTPTYRQFVRHVGANDAIELGHRYFAKRRTTEDDYRFLCLELEASVPSAQKFVQALVAFLVKERLNAP